MGLLEIFSAAIFFLIGTTAFFSLIIAQSKDFKDYPEVPAVSIFLAVTSLAFFALSGAVVYLGLASK
jgi:hypothetical protein